MRTRFSTPKKHNGLFSFLKFFVLFKYAKILDIHCIKNHRFNTCQNLGVFHTNQVFGRRKILDLFDLSKSLGFWVQRFLLTLYANPMSNTVKIFGYFIRTSFLTPKPHDVFAYQNLGVFKEYKDFGLTSYQNPRFNTCQILGVFRKNHDFERLIFDEKQTNKQKQGLLDLSRFLGFLRVQKLWAYIV